MIGKRARERERAHCRCGAVRIVAMCATCVVGRALAWQVQHFVSFGRHGLSLVGAGISPRDSAGVL